MGDDNHNANDQTWLLRDSLEIYGRQDRLPKHPKKLVPKVKPDSKELVEDHIQKFILANNLLNVHTEDVVCRFFPYTFEGKDST